MNHPREVRQAIRARRRTGRAFCERNPKPCPLLARSRPGDLTEELDNLERYWRDDLVTFVLG